MLYLKVNVTLIHTHTHKHHFTMLNRAKSIKSPKWMAPRKKTPRRTVSFFSSFFVFHLNLIILFTLSVCVYLSVYRVCLISIDKFVVISRTEEWMLNKVAFVYFPMNYVKKMESIKSSFDFIDLSCSVRFQFMVADPWWSMAIVSLVSAFELDCLVLVWFWAFGELMTRVRQFENCK